MATGAVSGLPAVRHKGRRLIVGLLIFILGGLAALTALSGSSSGAFFLGLLLLATAALQSLQAFWVGEGRAGFAGFFNSAMTALAGALLLATPRLAFSGLTILLGLSWIGAGLVAMFTAVRRHDVWPAVDGLVNMLLGLAIALQWPISGVLSLGIYVALHNLSAGWSMILGYAGTSAAATDETSHPDARLELPANPLFAELREQLDAADEAHCRTDRFWRWVLILMFFAIHVGRMDADWNLVGFLSPGVAVLGDLVYALFFAYAIVIPRRLAWRALTRPLERRAWRRLLARSEQGRGAGWLHAIRWWLTGRLHFALRVNRARRSPTAAVGRGLQIGLPLTGILVALNPVWGINWYFNTENWAAGFWEIYAEHRTDDWRVEMVRAVRDAYTGVPDDKLFEVTPEGVAGASDFSFIVIGDTGEGDASQHILRDQFLFLGQNPEVKFLVVSSDVIYPSGAMRDYEPKFYLPFKGFRQPIYALPGNHDWYDALEAFTANFLEPKAARAAMRARREADLRLTTTTEARIDDMIAEAARLRKMYEIRAGFQRAPYFEVQADRFALLVVDTGILKSVDDDQMAWLRSALKRSRGKFTMAILGHPLYAAGHYQGNAEPSFTAVHELLKEHQVEVVMAGDTHDFEYYREVYESRDKQRSQQHFVNGGGGAYLSIGTALSWPRDPATADWAFYPRADAIIDNLDRQTPMWKQPLWFWVKRLGAWPSNPEALAAAFGYNRAPFFQSFMEVRVEGSANVVRFLLYGPNGRLRWRDLQHGGAVLPSGKNEDDLVEFRVPLR
ncbi:MAG: hypothetical protein FJ271_15600 [Planctomycetes bacterium]|nr:hypothetical protein [Planctomycetota bacterium]